MSAMKGSEYRLLPHLVILLCLLTGIVVSIASITHIGGQAERLYQDAMTVRGAVGTMNTALETMQASIYRAATSVSLDNASDTVSSVEQSAALMGEQAALVRQSALDDEASLGKLEAQIADLQRMQEEAAALLSAQQGAEAVAYMEQEMAPVIGKMQAELAVIKQLADVREAGAREQIQRSQQRAIVLLLALGAIGVLASLGVGAYLKNERRRV